MLHPIDIVTKNNQLTGRTSDPEEANNKGFWHRGVHVVIYTASGQILLQKRSDTMIMHPSTIDIGIGGFVDSHETPEQAAVREVMEETGLAIAPQKLKHVATVRYNHRWRSGSRHKISRVILFTYLYRLADVPTHMAIQPEEVAWERFISFRSVQMLVRRHRFKSLGILTSRYGYYRRIIIALREALQT